MNKKQRKKLKKMKSLMRLTKRNSNIAKEKIPIENNLSGSEAKYLPKTKQQLLDKSIEKENVSGARSDKSVNSRVVSNVSKNELFLDVDFVNKKLPKELIIRIFSYLDINSLCRCACVSKYWNTLALDGSNWQYVDLFNFQTDVNACVVENLSKRCNDFLKAIRLENCRLISDASIMHLFSTCRNIEILNLKQCIKLSDNAFSRLGTNLVKLTNINLESCGITDVGTAAIRNGCPNLEFIDLSWCRNISSVALGKLVASCPNLKHFSSRGLANVTNQVLESLSLNCHKLKYLNINSCNVSLV